MLYYVQTESNCKWMSMCLCVCLLFVCLTKLKRRGNLSSVFSLLIPMWVCVCVFVFKSARVLVFFCIFCIQRFERRWLERIIQKPQPTTTTQQGQAPYLSPARFIIILLHFPNRIRIWNSDTRKWERAAVVARSVLNLVTATGGGRRKGGCCGNCAYN